MFYLITNLVKNFLSSFYLNLETICIYNNDFINELVLNDCSCYLTGNSLCSKLLNLKFNTCYNLIDRDIYVENIYPMELMRILIKYGDVYVYGIKNYNFKKSYKNVRFLLIPFNSISRYEFTYNHNYGANINSFIYQINSIADIDNINHNTISEKPFLNNIINEIEHKTWHYTDENNYLKSFENIMRCFNLCSYYDLTLENSTISIIKKNINHYIKNNMKYSSEIVYNELVKILNIDTEFKIFNIMYDVKCFELMNMKFINFKDTLNNLNKFNIKYTFKNTENINENTENINENTENINENTENIDENTENIDENIDEKSNTYDNDFRIIKFVILLDGLETNNIKRWCVANNINRVKNITNDIKKYYILFEYYEEYLKINTKYDMLLFLKKIIQKTNNGKEHIDFRDNVFKSFDHYFEYIKFIEYDSDKFLNLLDECSQYPISLKDINISNIFLNENYNIKWKDIKKIKNNLLDLIHKDELSNNNISIINYLDKTFNK